MNCFIFIVVIGEFTVTCRLRLCVCSQQALLDRDADARSSAVFIYTVVSLPVALLIPRATHVTAATLSSSSAQLFVQESTAIPAR